MEPVVDEVGADVVDVSCDVVGTVVVSSPSISVDDELVINEEVT